MILIKNIRGDSDEEVEEGLSVQDWGLAGLCSKERTVDDSWGFEADDC